MKETRGQSDKVCLNALNAYSVTGFPQIQDGSGRKYFGGSQSWYARKWMRMAGCASVAAANLAAFYGLGTGVSGVSGKREDGCTERSRPASSGNAQMLPFRKETYSKGEYLSLMENMFKIMKPGVLGFPFPGRFRRNFIRFAASRGVRLQAETMNHWKDPAQPLAFVRKALAGNDPVTMLILHHRSGELHHLTWHWMTITGCSAGDGILSISNYGTRESVDAAVLFEPSFGNLVKLLAFHPA